MSAHAAVKHELLVRYLDAWTAATLHGHKRASFVCATASISLVEAALRVFSEFADLLIHHPLDLVLAPHTPHPNVSLPDGVSIAMMAGNGPVLGLFDGVTSMVSAVAGHKADEALAFAPEPIDVVTAFQCRVELVDAQGGVEFLAFGAATEKSLEKFKDELWALDEYAGIRLRDPADATLLDIAIRPNVGPLRRRLAAQLRTDGPRSLAELRSWVQRTTVYRAADATTALQAMLSAGECRRDPPNGRLTPATRITSP